jgi:hypothetical protein
MWAKQNIGHIKTQLAIYSKFLFWIGKQQEVRLINPLETIIKQLVRERFLTLSILEDDI